MGHGEAEWVATGIHGDCEALEEANAISGDV